MSKAAFDKIMAGLNEALAIVRGEADPVKIYWYPNRGTLRTHLSLIEQRSKMLVRSRKEKK